MLYGHHIYCGKGMDQTGKVANPARGQLNREDEFLPVPVRYAGLAIRFKYW